MKHYVQSASQLELVIGCIRAAALRYNDRVRIEASEKSLFRKQLGKRIHTINERYVRFGEDPDPFETLQEPITNPATGLTRYVPVYPGQVARAGFHLLQRGPHGTQNWLTETKIKVQLPSGIWVQGDMDLAILGQEFRDYKTTTDFKYALLGDGEPPAEEKTYLRDDTQYNIYSWAWLQTYQDLTHAPGHWVYLRTKGKPDSHSVHAAISREENREKILQLDTIAKPWVEIRKKKTQGAQLPPTGLATGRCNKYNGCEYRGTVHCQITIDDVREYGGINMTVDFEALLEQHTQAQQQMQAVTPPPAPQAPARPAYWMPGDALNAVQRHWQERGAPLSMLALMADNIPPPEVAKTYDSAPAPQAAPVNPFTAPTAAQPQPPVEAGFVNPPESAGLPAVTQPPAPVQQPASQASSAEKAQRQVLKDRCVQLGLCDSSSKLGIPGLTELLRKAGQAVDDGGGPVPVGMGPGEQLAAAALRDQDALIEAIASRVVEKLADALSKYAAS